LGVTEAPPQQSQRPDEPGWWAKLKGEDLDLNALAESLTYDDLKIIRFGSGYYLRSSDFDGMTAAEEVERCAGEIVRVLNGAATVHFGNHDPVEVDQVARVSKAGAIQHFVFLCGGIRLRSRAAITVRTSDDTEGATPPSEVEVFARLGLMREEVERVPSLLIS
jgi:hypothetical protein